MVPAINTQDQWILVDTLNDAQLGLLSIGDTNFYGGSLRKNLDSRGRELLIDRIRRIVGTGQHITEHDEYGGERWQVIVEPIVSPVNQVVIGVLAAYHQEGEALPPRPVVGSIEWEIHEDGRRIETVWSNEMFTLYEVPRSGAGSATGDMSGWISQFIAPEDRARMKVVIDGGIAAPDGQRHLISYRILTRDGEDNPGSKQLEASGRVFIDENRPVKWLRSITREVSGLSPRAPQELDMNSAALVRAAFELSADRALIAIDLSCWQIFMTSPNWSSFSLRSPRYGYLPHTIHPDDYQRFRTLCQAADVFNAPAAVRFLQTDGSYRLYEVAASNGHFRSANERYIVASLLPVLNG
ncbi:hypothetical protein [Arthrobacter sp. A2-55]|uniref:hypothetical protein n=1 Tax=Arthrobacter sp. A2-55 TaxID=2897337 RepID=UPI0021CD4101|nr:hypothetical protein [Arthrobacter sp. A2-55]MCU6481290.1 hypothetical protein [Arthrobacter sp. A2-55]